MLTRFKTRPRQLAGDHAVPDAITAYVFSSENHNIIHLCYSAVDLRPVKWAEKARTVSAALILHGPEIAPSRLSYMFTGAGPTLNETDLPTTPTWMITEDDSTGTVTRKLRKRCSAFTKMWQRNQKRRDSERFSFSANANESFVLLSSNGPQFSCYCSSNFGRQICYTRLAKLSALT